MSASTGLICAAMGLPSPDTTCVHVLPVNEKGYRPCAYTGEFRCMFMAVAVPAIDCTDKNPYTCWNVRCQLSNTCVKKNLDKPSQFI